METLTATTLPPLPDPNVVMAQAQLEHNYYVLYLHYFFGAPLPANFPEPILKQFPNKSYKMQLKAAIANATTAMTGYLNIQNEYLVDYHVLYTHYANGVPLPANFPENILQQFPSSNYQQQLKGAIANLQNTINQEKAAM